MKKMKEKTARSLAAFLAAVCMFGTMPETALISRAEEGAAVSSETGDADMGGQEEKKADSGADGQTGTQTPGGEKTGEGTEETKKAEDAEGPKDTVKPGDSAEPGDGEDIEDTEDSKEPGGEGTKAPDSGDKEKEETAEPSPEGSTEETEGEITETVSENTVETEPEESEEVGMMLLSAQAEEAAAVQEADSTYTDENGVIYHYYGYEDGTAEIYELEDCKESTWDYKALNIPSRIEDYTVTRLTFSLPSETPTFPSVTIPETVTYMKDSLFKRMKISELHYNAEAAETGAGGSSTGVFFQAYIWGLHIGGNVKVIPDYCFDSAQITMDELTVDVERIGQKAFYNDKTITTLTIGENVKEIGREAFANNEIENINYNAVNARSEAYGQLVSGPFRYLSVSNITIGDKVTVIPEHLFCGIDYTADTLPLPECLTTIGAMAFYGDGISIGELTVGEHVESIGKMAFAVDGIGTLNYNAVEAQIEGMTDSENNRTPFWGVMVGTLQIGEQVKCLPDSLFYAMGLTQDTLTLPDSITYIGAYVLSHSGDAGSGKTVQIGTLEIGENVTHIGRAAFGVNTYDKVIVRTVEADTPPESDMDIELPLCSSVEIHGNSPYYTFFTRRTDKEQITLLCEDFETTRGEEYYDAQKKSFVTPITDSCTVCGYEETSEEYSEAHTVIFTDYDGRELSRQHLHKGEDATAPEEPERTGYRFTGWDRSFANVTSDLTVTAEYEIRKFSVVFKDGARIINEQEVAYGGNAAAPGNPTRPAEEWGSWKFTGWSGSYTNVTEDRVVKAQFEKIFNQYEVLFYDAEGNVISRQTVAHGEDAREPEPPEKESTAQHTYVFTGWSAATEGITGDTAFYPVYDAQTRSYTVTFVDGSTVLDTQTVGYGDDATAPQTPTRPEEDWGSWRFTGWSGSYTDVTEDRVIRAQFEKILNRYEVLFCDSEESVISRQTVEYGGDAIEPQSPTRPAEEWGSWRFTGWSGSFTDVTEDRVITAQFEKILNRYEVLFYDAEGNVISRQTVAHGEDAREPEPPEKESTAQYSYIFTGWSAATEGITGDTAFYPVYNTQTRSYTVKFMDGSTVLDTQTVEYGDDATAPQTPTRPEEDWGSWRFTGWSGSYTDVTGDRIIRAEFEKVFHVYEVIFYDADDNILSRQTVRHGMGAEAPKAPGMEPTEKVCYVFVGWDGDISCITGKSHFHPVYETKPRIYTVIFMIDDISYDVQKVAYGAAAVTPAAPVKEEDETYTYRFIGWDKDYSHITGDLTIHAVFEQVVKPKDDPDKPDDGGKDKDKDKDKHKDDDSDGDKSEDDGGDSGQQPGGDTDTGGGQPEGGFTENAGEKNGDPVPETIAEKAILHRETMPDMTGGKSPVFPIPALQDTFVQPGEKGKQTAEAAEKETMQETESEVPEDARRQIPGWLWLLLLLGAGTGAWSIWLWLADTAERTIGGTVMDEDGNAMSGVNVTLTGGKGNPVETQTDEDGQYLFEDLKKDSYRLCFHYIDATGLLLLDIHMGRHDGKKVFSILKSAVNAVKTRRSGGRYQIDVTV